MFENIKKKLASIKNDELQRMLFLDRMQLVLVAIAWIAILVVFARYSEPDSKRQTHMSPFPTAAKFR
jgi:hypothetical protein